MLLDPLQYELYYGNRKGFSGAGVTDPAYRCTWHDDLVRDKQVCKVRDKQVRMVRDRLVRDRQVREKQLRVEQAQMREDEWGCEMKCQNLTSAAKSSRTKTAFVLWKLFSRFYKS
jgi:hypothetical protein